MARVSMPTSNTRLTFTLNDFSGGLVNTVNDAKMKDNESPDMLNMQFRNDGLLQKRPGTVWLSSASISSLICFLSSSILGSFIVSDLRAL